MRSASAAAEASARAAYDSLVHAAAARYEELRGSIAAATRAKLAALEAEVSDGGEETCAIQSRAGAANFSLLPPPPPSSRSARRRRTSHAHAATLAWRGAQCWTAP